MPGANEFELILRGRVRGDIFSAKARSALKRLRRHLHARHAPHGLSFVIRTVNLRPGAGQNQAHEKAVPAPELLASTVVIRVGPRRPPIDAAGRPRVDGPYYWID
jgi:hypothetical protein